MTATDIPETSPATDTESMADRIAVLRAKQEAARASGGPDGLRRHRESGRLPVRERIDMLVDPDTWFEIGALALPELRRAKPIPGDAVVTGFGLLDGRRIGVIGIDASVVAGTTAPISMRKQGRLIEHAQRHGFPLVLLCDADGGRMPDVSGWRFSGLPLDFTTFLKPPPGAPVVPRAAAVLGPSYGDSALHASTAHYVVMIRNSSIALSGPSVVEPAIGHRRRAGRPGRRHRGGQRAPRRRDRGRRDGRRRRVPVVHAAELRAAASDGAAAAARA